MPELPALLEPMRWPIALAIAWIAGEGAFRFARIPRVSAYGAAGFLLGEAQAGLLPRIEAGAISTLANIALGLILFELGSRINLRWLRVNPWLGMTGAVEATATFAAIYATASWFGMPAIPALLIAALGMSTSPAALLRVVNEQASNGQVTERALHLTAFNCVLAVLAFKAIVGFSIFQSSGDVSRAIWGSALLLLFSAAIGVAFGVLVPGLLRLTAGRGRDVTVAFAIAVILLVSVVHSLQYSPLVASLAFGLTARHTRAVLSQPERNFGALGNLLAVLLFVFVAASLDWRHVAPGLGLGLAIVAARTAAKVAGAAAFARLAGITWKKGVLTGLALTPISAFVLLLLEQTRYAGFGLVGELSVLGAIVLPLEILGPIVAQRALMWAGEIPEARKA